MKEFGIKLSGVELNKNKINIVYDFITDEEKDLLVEYANNTHMWDRIKFRDGDFESNNNFWTGRVIEYEDFRFNNKKVANMMLDIRDRCAEIICNTTGVGMVYPNCLQLVRWLEGNEQQPHADIGTRDEFKYRDFGSILYINDDYDGGELYFPNQGIEYKPKAKSFAFFPGNEEYWHGIKRINKGTRYTIAMFWSFNKDYWDGFGNYFAIDNKFKV
jgi:hypothetical protein